MENPYDILGIARSATEAEIRAVYRKLAKRHHPDINPGIPESEERFKAISVAYSLLIDPVKRARFDRGEIDASGNERPAERHFYRDFGDAGSRTKYRAEAAFNPDDLEGIFGEAFRGRAGQPFSSRGRDVTYVLTVDFLDAANGAVRRVSLPDGRTLDVTIPAGIHDGQILRLKGQGTPGAGEGPPGDAQIEVTIVPHPLFRRDGNDIVMTLPLTLKEAVLGAEVPVPTIQGPVNLKVLPNATAGTRMRLKGRGIGGGDQYVELKVMLPPAPEPDLAAFLEAWTPRHPFDPREGMVQT
jgi:DnaJ-class molecular chaperone